MSSPESKVNSKSTRSECCVKEKSKSVKDSFYTSCSSDSDESISSASRFRSVHSRKNDVSPIAEGPSNCLSPQPSVIQSTTSLASIESFPEYETDSNLSIEEIKSRLSIHVGRQYEGLIKACKNYDSKNTGKIPRYQLKMILRTFCLPITLCQFEQLIEGIDKDEKGRIRYIEFFKSFRHFDDSKIADETVADDTLTVDQIVLLIKDSIFHCLHDVIRSFWLFDYNKDGYVRKNELRKILRNYCLKMSDRQFADLWIRYGNRDTGLVKYTTFLKKIGVHCERIKNQMPKFVPKDTPLWEESCTILKRQGSNYADTRRMAILTGKNDPSINGLTMVDVEKFFRAKLNRCGEILNRILVMFDRQEDGLINIDDLRVVLNCFVMPMADGLFRDLFARLNVEVKPISKTINIQNFLKKFCTPDPEARRTEMMSAMKDSGVQNIVDDIKNKMCNPSEKIGSAIKDISEDNDGCISKRKLKTILNEVLDCKLTMEDFNKLVSFLDPKGSGFIDSSTLLNIFDMNIENFQPASPESLGLSSSSLSEQYKELSGQKLISRMKHHINKNRKSFNTALLACDPHNCKLITLKQLRNILDNFCFTLTDAQFNALKPNFVVRGNRIEYETFLRLFEKTFDEDSAKWAAMVDKLSNYRTVTPKEVPLNEVEEMLQDVLKVKYKVILRDFKILDPCKMGVVYKDDARAVFNRSVLRMTHDQFDHVWRKFPLNSHNCLLYEQLLQKYVQRQESRLEEEEVNQQCEDEDNASTSAVSAKQERLYVEPGVGIKHMPKILPKGKKVKPPEGHEEFQKAIFTTYPHLKDTYQRLKPTIMKHFSAIRHHIRRLDKNRTGNINFQVLQGIIEAYDGKFIEEDVYHLLEYFDPNLTGDVSHRDFMRLFAWYC